MQLKQNKFEIEVLKHQNAKLIQKLSNLERKLNLMHMPSIKEEVNHVNHSHNHVNHQISSNNAIITAHSPVNSNHNQGYNVNECQEEKARSNSNNNNQNGVNITKITSELLLYRQKFSSLQEQVHSPSPKAIQQEAQEEKKCTAPSLNDKQQELQDWLKQKHLNEYFDNFISNGFDDLDTLKLITNKELTAIGIDKIGHKMKIMRNIQSLIHPSLNNMNRSPSPITICGNGYEYNTNANSTLKSPQLQSSQSPSHSQAGNRNNQRVN